MVSFGLDAVLEDRRPDVVDVPTVAEGLPYLPLSDPPRERVVARVLVAKTEHEVSPAGCENGREAHCEERPVFVGEDMEETGVDDGIEFSVEPNEIQRVPDEKTRRESPCGGLLLGFPDRKSCGVDPEHLMPFLCKKENMVPRSASHVQDGADNLSRPGEFDERLLGPADLPGGRAQVGRVEDVHT